MEAGDLTSTRSFQILVSSSLLPFRDLCHGFSSLLPLIFVVVLSSILSFHGYVTGNIYLSFFLCISLEAQERKYKLRLKSLQLNSTLLL